MLQVFENVIYCYYELGRDDQGFEHTTAYPVSSHAEMCLCQWWVMATVHINVIFILWILTKLPKMFCVLQSGLVSSNTYAVPPPSKCNFITMTTPTSFSIHCSPLSSHLMLSIQHELLVSFNISWHLDPSPSNSCVNRATVQQSLLGNSSVATLFFCADHAGAI
jgi:hypothetical protein